MKKQAKKEKVLVSLDPEMAELLRVYAFESRRNRSQVVTQAIRMLIGDRCVPAVRPRSPQSVAS